MMLSLVVVVDKEINDTKEEKEKYRRATKGPAWGKNKGSSA